MIIEWLFEIIPVQKFEFIFYIGAMVFLIVIIFIFRERYLNLKYRNQYKDNIKDIDKSP
jgi:ATP/ADP translocase